MSLIESAASRTVLDSRGNATVEVEIITENGYGMVAAPSGASTGEHEVQAFPEGGVEVSLKAFEDDVAPQLIGMDATEQKLIDSLLHQIDGTANFSLIGGNLAVATSLAVARAAATTLGVPLYQYVGGSLADSIPMPLGNLIGGGRHAIGGTDIQEFLVISTSQSARKSSAVNSESCSSNSRVTSSRWKSTTLNLFSRPTCVSETSATNISSS